MAPDANTDDEEEMLCERHDVQESPFSDGTCPYCMRERDMEARQRERMERRADPDMHPTVDAPRR